MKRRQWIPWPPPPGSLCVRSALCSSPPTIPSSSTSLSAGQSPTTPSSHTSLSAGQSSHITERIGQSWIRIWILVPTVDSKTCNKTKLNFFVKNFQNFKLMKLKRSFFCCTGIALFFSFKNKLCYSNLFSHCIPVLKPLQGVKEGG